METTDAAIVAVSVIVVRQLLEMAAKAIPDSETGWRGSLRMLLKTLAMYIPNQR